jgi:tetratricopeptide (TPR) repeat protein
MTPELWQRLKPLYNSAVEMREPKRGQFIARACGTNTELRAALESLLRAADQPTGSEDKPFIKMKDVLRSTGASFCEGEIILGRFEIVRLLGTGGMGEVFEANDRQLGRIAIKTIQSQIASSRRAFGRFRQEIALARKVSGPQVCRIHELFLLPATGQRPATAFLTMEYLDGVTLNDKLAEGGTFSPKDTLKIALDICEGLRLIHEQKIVHRDLKSSNIMLCERNGAVRAVLMDFGLARHATAGGSSPDATTRSAPTAGTLPGTIAGTPAYMAPEQFEGKPVSPATDIYAFGVILYELLTGLHPYAAATPIGAAVRRSKRQALPSSVRHKIPRHWDRVVQRCLEYEPSERFQSAEEVAKALTASPLRIGNLRSDRPWVLRVTAIVALAAMAWGGFCWWQLRQYYHPTLEEQRWYNEGLASLREGSYLKATKEFEKATQHDGRFVMAHARLAEAWADLDFDGTAKQEMLIATTGEHHLPALDRMYLDAIRATLTRDFAGALVIYRRILDRLPDSQRATGYVDLGRAYEHAGDPGRALENYAHASRLDSENPAPHMRSAILDSRLHKVQAANDEFSRAEKIYAAEMNQEGQAELDYERGYLANESGDSNQANIFLKRSLEEAKQIQSVQLEIRALTQLSSSASASGDSKDGVDFAQQAIQLARDNQLDAWAANALARLAQARIVEGSEHFQEAEEAVDEAKTLAIQTQQPRAEALANGVLASLRDQQDRPDDVVAPAKTALAYYNQNGYFEAAAKATLALLRVDESRGEFQQTLRTANSFLALAEQSGNIPLIVLAEQHVGATYDSAERYPDALQHFQKARELASNETTRAFEAQSCAQVLIKLGRFGDAEALLTPINKVGPLILEISEAKSDEFLAQEKYSSVVTLATGLLTSQRDMDSDDLRLIHLQRAVAEAHLHETAQALGDVQNSESNGKNEKASGHPSEPTLQIVEVELSTGNAKQAREDAAKAEQYFASNGQLDSDLRANLLAAAASKSLNDAPTQDKFSAKAVDNLSSLEHTWDPQVFRTYLSRPDLRTLMRVLPRNGFSNTNGR